MGTFGSWIKRHHMTRHSFVTGAVGAGAMMAVAGDMAGCANRPTKLAIVHTNDSHGHDILNDESLGIAAAVQLRSDYEAKGYEVLLLDAGDAVQGDNLVGRSKGDSAIDIMNKAAYDAMALGNHEFDYGQDKIGDYVAAANFPILSANVYVDATGDRLIEPNTIFNLQNGSKVGVFGLTTPQTVTSANPLLVQGLTFLENEELYTCAQEQVDELRSKGCSLIVCLAHLGEEDILTGNRALDVASHVSGIDLIIDGHDHLEEHQVVKDAAGADTLIVETGCYTHAVGVVTWEDGKLEGVLEEFGSYDGQDATVASYVQGIYDDVYSELDQLVATVAFTLDGEKDPGVRNKETNLGDLVADAILWEAKMMADDLPDCSIIGGGNIRTTLPAGDITVGDVINVLPFIDDVRTLRVTGAQMLEAFEAACAATPDPEGGFPQVAGISFTVDTTKPYAEGEEYPNSTYKAPADPGSRVTIHDVGGRGFDLNEDYVVATTSFICAGGDSYYVFSEAAQASMKSINYMPSDCLQYYLEEACAGVVPDEYSDPAGQGRIEVLS